MKCNACHKPAVVKVVATILATDASITIYVCKGHLLDPGPLLDFEEPKS